MRLRIVLTVLCLAGFLSLSFFRASEAQSLPLRASADQRGSTRLNIFQASPELPTCRSELPPHSMIVTLRGRKP